MFEATGTETFDAWLQVLKDAKGRAKIQVRIDRFANGNPGEVGPIGEGLVSFASISDPGDACITVDRASRSDDGSQTEAT